MRYADIKEMDISNGEGIGVSLFVQGCHFHCKNCFNQSTWNFNGGKEWTEDTENNFISLCNKDFINRISILGGEPLADENVLDIFNLIIRLKCFYPYKKIWLFTGYDFDIFNDNVEWSYSNLLRKIVMKNVDVLVDGRYVDELKDYSLKWRGSSNQKVIDVQKSFKSDKIELYCD